MGIHNPNDNNESIHQGVNNNGESSKNNYHESVEQESRGIFSSVKNILGNMFRRKPEVCIFHGNYTDPDGNFVDKNGNYVDEPIRATDEEILETEGILPEDKPDYTPAEEKINTSKETIDEKTGIKSTTDIETPATIIQEEEINNLPEEVIDSTQNETPSEISNEIQSGLDIFKQIDLGNEEEEASSPKDNNTSSPRYILDENKDVKKTILLPHSPDEKDEVKTIEVNSLKEKNIFSRTAGYIQTPGNKKKILKRAGISAVALGGAISAGVIKTSLDAGEQGKNPRTFSGSYDNVVTEFLEKQDERLIVGEGLWVKPSGVEYSDSHFGKLENLPYESPPLMKVQQNKNGRIGIIDGGWIDDNGNILSTKEMLTKNKELLGRGVNFNPEELYFISISNSVLEQKYAGDTVQYVRKMLPDDILEIGKKTSFTRLYRTASQSALKVKHTTLEDYSPEEQELMLNQLANFQIIPQSRDRGINGVKGLGSDKKYVPIWKLFEYTSPDDFKAAWKNGEVENKTRGEIGIALGMIVTNHIHAMTRITQADFQEAVNKLKEKGILIDKSRVARTSRLLKGFYVNGSATKTYGRVASYYPTNVPKTIHGTKAQTLLNVIAINNGQYENMTTVDGGIGEKTIELAEILNLKGIQESTTPELSIPLMERAETETLSFSEKLNNLYKENKENDSISLTSEEEDLLFHSMNVNTDTLWNAYRTISYFLNQNNEFLLLEQLETDFATFVSSNNKKPLLTRLEYYSKAKNINKHFGEQGARFLHDLTQNEMLIVKVGMKRGFVPNKYAPASFTSNEKNTVGRATINLYEDFLEKYNKEKTDTTIKED